MKLYINSNDNIADLIDEHLFFAFCTAGYKDYDLYESQADLILILDGVHFFFKFSDTYKSKLSK